MGFYGDDEVHHCPKCKYEGPYLDFDPILDKDNVVGFECEKCRFAFWEDTDGEITSTKGQSKLNDFMD